MQWHFSFTIGVIRVKSRALQPLIQPYTKTYQPHSFTINAGSISFFPALFIELQEQHSYLNYPFMAILRGTYVALFWSEKSQRVANNGRKKNISKANKKNEILLSL